MKNEKQIQFERIEKLRWQRAETIKPYYDFFEEKKGLNLGNITKDEFNSLLKKLKKDKAEEEKFRLLNEAKSKRIDEEKSAKTSHETDKFDSLQKIVDQLEKCDYECIGGALANNIAFVKLKELANKESK